MGDDLISGYIRFLFDENINVFLQSFGDHSIDLIFKAITNIFSEPGFLLLSIIIFWCFDKKIGIRLMYLIFLSAIMAFFLKSTFGLERPPQSIQKIAESGFGFPSGHALVTSGSCWYLAGIVRKKWMVAAGIISIVAVSLSRIYLGVHYAGDVIGGALFGFLIAFIFLNKESIIASKLNELDLRSKYILAAIIPFILILSGLLESGLLVERIENGFVMAGAGIGYLSEEEKIRFEPAKDNGVRIKRTIIGSLILGIIYLITGIDLPGILFLRYILLGFTSTFIAPWLFMKIEAMHKWNKLSL